jgi:hypothetical protein
MTSQKDIKSKTKSIVTFAPFWFGEHRDGVIVLTSTQDLAHDIHLLCLYLAFFAFFPFLFLFC